jgi:hypothetical protein
VTSLVLAAWLATVPATGAEARRRAQHADPTPPIFGWTSVVGAAAGGAGLALATIGVIEGVRDGSFDGLDIGYLGVGAVLVTVGAVIVSADAADGSE